MSRLRGQVASGASVYSRGTRRDSSATVRKVSTSAGSNCEPEPPPGSIKARTAAVRDALTRSTPGRNPTCPPLRNLRFTCPNPHFRA